MPFTSLSFYDKKKKSVVAVTVGTVIAVVLKP